jgi:hypothetical protein
MSSAASFERDPPRRRPWVWILSTQRASMWNYADSTEPQKFCIKEFFYQVKVSSNHSKRNSPGYGWYFRPRVSLAQHSLIMKAFHSF